MAILDFQKPDKVIMIDSTDTFGNLNSVHWNPGMVLRLEMLCGESYFLLWKDMPSQQSK
jgi:hypothetical protein